jgi:hypothetical protein
MHPAIRNPLRIHSGRARKGDLQFPVQAAPSCRPVSHCAIPPDGPKAFSPSSPAAPRRKMRPRLVPKMLPVMLVLSRAHSAIQAIVPPCTRGGKPNGPCCGTGSVRMEARPRTSAWQPPRNSRIREASGRGSRRTATTTCGEARQNRPGAPRRACPLFGGGHCARPGTRPGSAGR